MRVPFSHRIRAVCHRHEDCVRRATGRKPAAHDDTRISDRRLPFVWTVDGRPLATTQQSQRWSSAARETWGAKVALNVIGGLTPDPRSSLGDAGAKAHNDGVDELEAGRVNALDVLSGERLGPWSQGEACQSGTWA
jgi:hypothetical protein